MAIWEFSGPGGNNAYKLIHNAPPPPEEPENKWVAALKSALLISLLVLCGWGLYTCSSKLAEQRAAQRAALILSLEKQCEIQPHACAVEIVKLREKLKKEEGKAGFGAGFVTGILVR